MDPLTIIAMATGLYKLASQIRIDLMQRGEWTDMQEEAWKTQGDALFNSPAWQPTDGKVYNL